MSSKPRKCNGCGWVYPPSYNKPRCKFCGTYFKERYCRVCGQLKKPAPQDRTMCRECFNERRRSDWKHILFNQRAYQERLERHDTAYKEWLELITSKPFKPLTGKQWLKACAYFNGCALCTSNPIAARGYFVQFKDGGRYTAWNIIPLCEKCATARIVQSNPFRRLDPRLNPNGIPADRFEKILNYLREQLEEE